MIIVMSVHRRATLGGVDHGTLNDHTGFTVVRVSQRSNVILQVVDTVFDGVQKMFDVGCSAVDMSMAVSRSSLHSIEHAFQVMELSVQLTNIRFQVSEAAVTVSDVMQMRCQLTKITCVLN